MLIPYSLRAGAKSSRVRVNLLSCCNRYTPYVIYYTITKACLTLTFPDFLELCPEPRILQCCRASFAMSEMNFCAASDTKRMLKGKNKLVKEDLCSLRACTSNFPHAQTFPCTDCKITRPYHDSCNKISKILSCCVQGSHNQRTETAYGGLWS